MSTGSWTHDPGKCSAKVATARTYSKSKPFCNRTIVDDRLCRIHLAVRERAKTRASKPTYAELRSALDAVEARLAAVRYWIETRGVDVGDRDDEYMRGYRDAQRRAILDAAEALAIIDGRVES